MKLLPISLLGSLLLASAPAQANPTHYVTTDTVCYKEVYKETYVPGTKHSRGYVTSRTEKVKVPCQSTRTQPVPAPTSRVDDNSCVEGSILGAIAGGGAGAAFSRGRGRAIGIPLGIVGGALIGCQIDGG